MCRCRSLHPGRRLVLSHRPAHVGSPAVGLPRPAEAHPKAEGEPRSLPARGEFHWAPAGSYLSVVTPSRRCVAWGGDRLPSPRRGGPGGFCLHRRFEGLPCACFGYGRRVLAALGPVRGPLAVGPNSRLRNLTCRSWPLPSLHRRRRCPGSGAFLYPVKGSFGCGVVGVSDPSLRDLDLGQGSLAERA